MTDAGITLGLPERALIRVDEAAKYFGVTKMTIYRWYEAEKLTGTMINNTLRIYRQSILDLIMSGNGQKLYKDKPGEGRTGKPKKPSRRIISAGI